MSRDPYQGETVVVPEERHGVELDEFLCLYYVGVPKGFLRRLVREGRVLVDGIGAKTSQRLRGGQVLIVDLDEDELPARPVAPSFRVSILYEDEDVLVVDKPAGIAVEPERWARHLPSLAGALVELARERAEAGGVGGEHRYRLAHRIDKDTSGCLLVAKHLEAERALRIAFSEGRVHKEYLALVEGEHPLGDDESETSDAPIGPDPRKSGRMVVSKDGKPSRTEVRVAERFRGFTLLSCRPVTGRTHQIRVHLAQAGYPLAVDPQYGRRDELFLSGIKADYRPKRGRPERPLIARLTLHAHALHVPDPSAGADAVRCRIEAPLPKDYSTTLKQLRKVRPRRAPRRDSR